MRAAGLHPDKAFSASSSTYKVLAEENEAYYRSLGPQESEKVAFAVDYVIENGLEGAHKLSISNFELSAVFTTGSRPEIKQDCKMLFGCLNKDLNQPSNRARQKFVSEEYSEQVQMSLFLHVIEIWCPGLVRDETLLKCHIDPALLPHKGSCSFSALLCDAQVVVQSFRPGYREQVMFQEKENCKDGKTTVVPSSPCFPAEISLLTIQKLEGQKDSNDKCNLSRISLTEPFHEHTLSHYNSLQSAIDKASAETQHVISHIRENCVKGCRLLSLSELRIKNIFTGGKRPEIKKEAKPLFMWLTGKAYDHLMDRPRQKFTHESDADHYRYSLFLYTVELWRPMTSSVETLRKAYIPPTRSGFTGVMSSALRVAQQAVYELRQDLSEGGKPALSEVKITKFQKQHGMRQRASTPIHEYKVILCQLRSIFNSKIDQINTNKNVEGSRKRKQEPARSFEGLNDDTGKKQKTVSSE